MHETHACAQWSGAGVELERHSRPATGAVVATSSGEESAAGLAEPEMRSLEHVHLVVSELEPGQRVRREVSGHELYQVARQLPQPPPREGARWRGADEVEDRSDDEGAPDGAQPRPNHAPEPCPAPCCQPRLCLHATARDLGMDVRGQGRGLGNGLTRRRSLRLNRGAGEGPWSWLAAQVPSLIVKMSSKRMLAHPNAPENALASDLDPSSSSSSAAASPSCISRRTARPPPCVSSGTAQPPSCACQGSTHACGCTCGCGAQR
eukprot:1218581-Rhodomonas_salina.1